MTKRPRQSAQQKPAQPNPVAAAVAGILALPAVKAELERKQHRAVIGQQLVQLSEAGRAFGADVVAFVSDTTPARCAQLRRDVLRMLAEIDKLEALVTEPTTDAKPN